MSLGLKPVKTASKDILARCMATEDITVEHRADAQSAYFDTKNRLLCLPVWKQMDNSVYDMLVGHEVSHALHTPAEGWQDFVGTGPDAGNRHMFLNIVEDARIERLIKDKFPGLRRDFASAYNTLYETGLFELDGKNISELPLIDRLNLEFKLGLFGLINVDFDASETPYVTRMAETTTFEEVMTLAEDLFNKYQQEQQEQEQQESGQPEAGDGEGSGSGGLTSPDSEESGEGEGSATGDGEDSDDESTGEGSGSGEGDESDEDSGASADDDTDDGESADSEDVDGNSDVSGELDYDDYEANQTVGETQKSFENGVGDLRDDEAKGTTYRTLPKMNLEHCIVGWKTITDDLNGYFGEFDARSQQTFAESRSELQSFLTASKPTVQHMVQQFQMKQAADADKRTSIAKTGVLDTTTMINYRWSEDIFVKNEVHADGKSHGMVIFVDWSGSMAGILKDTVEQLLVLVEFSRKANIPFEVYGFSSNQFVPTSRMKNIERYSKEWDAIREEIAARKQYTTDREDNLQPHEFQLYHWLSSDMNARQYKTAVTNFWFVANAQSGYRYAIPSCYSLGCTPLNEAILCAIQIVPEFQSRNGIQIVNTVVLSDGEGHGIGLGGRYYGGSSILRDQKSHKTYKVNRERRIGAETDALVQCLKDKTGCNAISIRLHDSKHIKNLRYTYWDTSSVEGDAQYSSACSEYKSLNFTTVPNSGYDEYFIVKGDVKVEFDALDALPDDATFTRLKNAFLKGNTSKKTSRVIANRIIDIIAA
jgi:hypothetical protein